MAKSETGRGGRRPIAGTRYLSAVESSRPRTGVSFLQQPVFKWVAKDMYITLGNLK